jgi:hypothetical protein
MLLAPDRGRGWERGRRPVGLTVHSASCAIAPRMRLVAKNTCNPLSPPLPLSGARSMRGEMQHKISKP